MSIQPAETATVTAKPHTTAERGTQVSVDVPLRDGRLFGSDAADAVLDLLARNADEAFSVSEVAAATDHSRATVTRAVEVLAGNDLVVDERDGRRRLVRINRERLSRPDDPYLDVPRAEFHAPVRAAVDALVDRLDDVLGVVLYGSVARGEADRRSDVDLWVLVCADRPRAQRRANRVRQSLEDDTFGGERYAFEIDVEAVSGLPAYEDEVREILTEGIALHRTEAFDTARRLTLRGDVSD